MSELSTQNQKYLELFGKETNLETIKNFIETGGNLHDYHIKSFSFAPYIHTTILHLICMYNLDYDIIRYCVEKGGNLNIVSEIIFNTETVTTTPFYMLCMVHYRTLTKKIIKLCVKNGADLNTKHDGCSPLYWICNIANENKSELSKILKYIGRHKLATVETIKDLHKSINEHLQYFITGTLVHENDNNYLIY